MSWLSDLFGTGPQTQTQSSGPPAWLQGTMQGYLQNQGGLSAKPWQGYQGQMVADINPLTSQAMQGFGGLMNSPDLNDAGAYYRQVMGGSQNPAGGGWGHADPYAAGMNGFIDQVGNRVAGDVTKNYHNATAQNLSRFRNRTSSAYQQAQGKTDEALARGLTDGMAPIYANAYEANANRQTGGYESAMGRQFSGNENAASRGMGAAQGLQGLFGSRLSGLGGAMQAGQVGQNWQQQVLDAERGRWTDWLNHGQTQNDRMGGAINRVMGGAGQTQTQTTPGNNPLAVAGGLGSMLYGMFGK